MQIESILNLLAQPQWNFPQFNRGTMHKSKKKDWNFVVRDSCFRAPANLTTFVLSFYLRH